ncbi:unnamed protein product [Penicillium nalgiovense]|nr:unnamed protein product [Penicillium nalgiovense]
MLQENHINAIVSLTSARWVRWYSTTRNAGVSEHRHKWIQCADSTQTSCASFNQSKESNRARISLVSFKFWEEVEYEVWEDEDNTVPKAPYKAFLEIRAALLKEKGLTGDEPLAPLTL